MDALEWRRWAQLAALATGTLLCATSFAQERPAPLLKVADVPLAGPAVRFDYQSMDAEHGRLYISHMNADQLVVFDTKQRTVMATLDGFKRVHGVIAVPQIQRIFASATGDHRVNVVEMSSLKTIATPGPIQYPDGLAYAPPSQRLFVSDEQSGVDAVIDVRTNNLIRSIPLGGGAGNTVYDPGSGLILVAVHGINQIVEIDPVSLKIVGRYFLREIQNPHGVALDPADHLAFIAGEENHALAVFDLKTDKVISVHQVGDDPDVLAFDPGLKRLYVSAESGTVTVFSWQDGLRKLGDLYMPHAHSVAVDAKTHLVYFPLQNMGKKPILRIMRPSGDLTSK